MADDDPFEGPDDYRVFGAGIKRKRVAFVPASDPSTVDEQKRITRNQKSSLAEQYLAITLGKEETSARKPEERNEDSKIAITSSSTQITAICQICKAPINSNDKPEDTAINPTASETHESSIAHQACLQHSYPPSHLDRTRQGLKYLSSYGWDPDSRLGLGAAGEGIRVPIKAKQKNNTVGLGIRIREGSSDVPKKVERLDAKGVRKRLVEEKARERKLHDRFYASVDVEKYLGA